MLTEPIRDSTGHLPWTFTVTRVQNTMRRPSRLHAPPAPQFAHHNAVHHHRTQVHAPPAARHADAPECMLPVLLEQRAMMVTYCTFGRHALPSRYICRMVDPVQHCNDMDMHVGHGASPRRTTLPGKRESRQGNRITGTTSPVQGPMVY
jgi:hypothetical protein